MLPRARASANNAAQRPPSSRPAVISVAVEGDALVAPQAGQQHAHPVRGAARCTAASLGPTCACGKAPSHRSRARVSAAVGGWRNTCNPPARPPRRRHRTPTHRSPPAALRPWRQPSEGRRRRTALAPQFAGGEDRDARRVQAAAQMDAYPAGAAQAVLHRPRIQGQKLLGVVVVGGRCRPRHVLRPPVALQPHRAVRDDEAMPRRQPAHGLEERACGGERRVPLHQPHPHREFVELVADVRAGEHGFDGGWRRRTLAASRHSRTAARRRGPERRTACASPRPIRRRRSRRAGGADSRRPIAGTPSR